MADYVPGQATSNRQLAPWYDGNVMGWMENDGVQPLPQHRLEYDPYGKLLVDDTVRPTRNKKQRDLGVSEEWLERPAFAFSTKYEDAETGLLYYGFRYYAPEMGRWISRDPIGERGGVNLYGMVDNNAVNGIDYLGLSQCDKIKKTIDRTNKTIDFVKRKIKNIQDEIYNKRIPDIINNPGELPWSIPGAKPREDIKGHVVILHKLREYLAEYKKYEKALDAEKAALWAAYNACLIQEKMMSKNKAGKVALRFAGRMARRIPIVLIFTFAYDASASGVAHAFNEATWPVSLIWTCGEDDLEDSETGGTRSLHIEDGPLVPIPHPEPLPPNIIITDIPL